ncbi:MAG: hypothetical protein PHF86_07940 [Candidatus Nanoarchaeia archaeon]|nr:hypothetical protein [Candidatus Nanoarchaeia archaeon]
MNVSQKFIYNFIGYSCLFGGLVFLYIGLTSFSSFDSGPLFLRLLFPVGYIIGSLFWFTISSVFLLGPYLQAKKYENLMKHGLKLQSKYFNV